jgi:hypothetical protein
VEGKEEDVYNLFVTCLAQVTQYMAFRLVVLKYTKLL